MAQRTTSPALQPKPAKRQQSIRQTGITSLTTAQLQSFKSVKHTKSKQIGQTTTRRITPRQSAALTPAEQLPDISQLKIAIVCDWLTGTGGAERVVLELHRLYPKAPIYTSQYTRGTKIWYGDTWFNDADVQTTWLQHLPVRFKKFLPVLRAYSFRRLDLSAYDLVVVSSGAEAKAVMAGPDTTVVWYCHAPTHYYWSRYNEYMRSPGFGRLDFLARLGLWTLVRPLRGWDYRAAQRPDVIIANSTHTSQAVKQYYNRSSSIVFPPVDTKRFQVGRRATAVGSERFGFVIAGRQTPYKRIDLAVEACSRLNLPLTVIGDGPEHNKLTALAGQSIRFMTRISDAEMAHYFQAAEAFIFPGIDDFGIVCIEAMSAGTPVIAYQAGGALDYIKPGVTGEFFAEQTVDSLMTALKQFQASGYDATKITTQAEKYNITHFINAIQKAIVAAVSHKASAKKSLTPVPALHSRQNEQ